MQKITVFKNIREVNNPFYTYPTIIYEYIKNGRYRSKIEDMRGTEDKKERKRKKEDLPSICWSGMFEKREDASIIKHSGLVCVDFDHLEDVEGFKKRLSRDRYTYMAFISPSGDGVKLIMKIPNMVKTHKDSCRAITEYFKNDKLDEFTDISRVCFISYDPEIYINPDSDIFTNLLEEKQRDEQKVFYPKERLEDDKAIFEKLIKWLDNKFEYYTDGNKHKYIVKLASACMRFGLSISTCTNFMVYEFQNKASYVPQKDFDVLINRVYKNYSAKACTAYFEVTGKAVYASTKKEVNEEIFDIEADEKDIIYLDNVKQSMFEGFKTGKSRGETTYFRSFDRHWTWRRKEVTFVGGIGNAGKTTFMNNLFVIKAMKDDWKFAIFSPEQDPPDDFYNDLIHIYMGKSTEPYHQNQMTEDEYKNAMKFIGSHFFYIYPETESPTPDYINICFELLIKKHKIDCCVVDPFNQLDNDWKRHNRDDLYISEFLSKCKRFSQIHNVAYFIAGHPKGTLQKIGGNYEEPKVYDYAGGAMWNNKCDNILCYHRPSAQTDPSNTECKWISQKIKKRKLTGMPGEVTMIFDVMTNRFLQEDRYDPFIGMHVIESNPDGFIEPFNEDNPPF